MDKIYGERLARIRKTDADYRENRSAVLNDFFRTQIAEYLLGSARFREDAAHRSGRSDQRTAAQPLPAGRWKDYLAESRSSGEPVFGLWNAAAAIPDAEFAKKWPAVLAAQSTRIRWCSRNSRPRRRISKRLPPDTPHSCCATIRRPSLRTPSRKRCARRFAAMVRR